MDASIWDQILARVETKVNRHSFYTWFKQTAFVADGGSSITVRVPNPLFRDWLTKQYAVVLADALAEVGRSDASLIFVAEGAVVADRIDALTERVQSRYACRPWNRSWTCCPHGPAEAGHYVRSRSG